MMYCCSVTIGGDFNIDADRTDGPDVIRLTELLGDALDVIITFWMSALTSECRSSSTDNSFGQRLLIFLRHM